MFTCSGFEVNALSAVPHSPTILWTRAKMRMEKGNAHKSTIISWLHLNNHICVRIRTDGYGCLEGVGFQADCYNSSPDLRACAALMLIKPIALSKPISVSLHSCFCEYMVSLLFQPVAPRVAQSGLRQHFPCSRSPGSALAQHHSHTYNPISPSMEEEDFRVTEDF